LGVAFSHPFAGFRFNGHFKGELCTKKPRGFMLRVSAIGCGRFCVAFLGRGDPAIRQQMFLMILFP
jgi:hypothetical protein